MYFVIGQQFIQSIGESLVVNVSEDVVNSTVLKQIVLYACIKRTTNM